MFSFISGNTEGDDHPPTLMQQLKSELNQKNMLFSKECIKIFTVIGQGILKGYFDDVQHLHCGYS